MYLMSKLFYSLDVLSKKPRLPSLLLGLATLLALLMSNSSAKLFYNALLHTSFPIIGIDTAIDGLYIVNEGLMVLFFTHVTLEIKRECLMGRLSNRRHAVLPLCAALGGVIAPAILYTGLASYEPALLKGWAIPTATDIAFSLAVLSLLGRSIPLELKLFLSGLAIIDDLCAVGVIAIFYTEQLQWFWLRWGLLFVLLLWVANKRRVESLWAYWIIGFALWLALLKSGIHPTIAGVVLGGAIPLNQATHQSDLLDSPLQRVEHYLAPWINYIILPSFAFMNAGVPVLNMTLQVGAHPLFMGIFIGLCLGKPLGIVSGAYLATRLGIAQLPRTLMWQHIIGVGCLGGIGFTMSLFISALAFSDLVLLQLARQAILMASIVSGTVGMMILARHSRYYADSSHKHVPANS